MRSNLFIASMISVSLAACSSVNTKKQADGDFDYAAKQQAKTLAVPSELAKPKAHHDYFVNDKINHQGPVGSHVDVRAPALPLPLAASSRVEEKSQYAQIWFDKVLEDQPLKPLIIEAIQQTLAEQGSEMLPVDNKLNVVRSSWVNKTQEEGMWWWTSVNTLNRAKFVFDLNEKSHHRSVMLTVKLVDYQNVNSAEKTLDPIDKQRAEVAMLNDVIGQVDYIYRSKAQQLQQRKATEKIVSISKTESGKAAYLIELERDNVWSNLPSFFEKYGFSIYDLNETKRIYYVDYKKPDQSFWQSLWGDDQPILELAEAKYQFKLINQEQNTLVEITNEQGEALSEQQLQQLFDAIEPGLSFRNN